MKAFFSKWMAAALIVAFVCPGCGYTRKATLPNNIKSIYVDTVKNNIQVTDVYAYKAGLEIDITNEIVRRLNTDGNLRVTTREDADAVLECKLIEYSQGGLRFTNLERIQEYRLYVTISMRLVDAKTGAIIWEEPEMTGDAEYEVQRNEDNGDAPSHTTIPEIPRDEATRRAIDRLAHNVVDRIVEDW